MSPTATESAHAATPREQANNVVAAVSKASNRTGDCRGPVITRVPPEPSGHAHLGIATSICLTSSSTQLFLTDGDHVLHGQHRAPVGKRVVGPTGSRSTMTASC